LGQVNRRTAKGSTALLMAATTTVGLSPLHLRVARPDFPAVVRALVHAGADVNLPGANPLTHQQIAAALPLPSVILKPLSHAKSKHTGSWLTETMASSVPRVNDAR
jgi:hypothetical protein